MANGSPQRPIPRLVPEQAFPAYSYIPGRFPHPLSDPRGHSFGLQMPRPQPPDPDQWRFCRPYLYGIDLFNHGYFWEAHEVWESLWHACGRSGRTGCFLKGLIKLAAAGVKVRQGIPQGVRSHTQRAAELFRQIAENAGEEDARYLGLHLGELIRFAQEIDAARVPNATAFGGAVTQVFDFILSPA